jgi:SHS2 domain-containing protein
MPFRFLPDVALADVAFEARSTSSRGLFEASAAALTAVMVDRRTVVSRVQKTITVSSEDLDRLLYDFLTELIIAKDIDSFLFREFKVTVDEGACTVRCIANGEPIDRVRHKLRNDVKAVTMHMFGIKHERDLWTATVVLDI